MDVALDGADDHLAHTRRAGFGQKRLEDGHAALHRVGGQKHLGDKEDTVAEILAHDGHAADQRLGQDVIGSPFAFEQDVHGLLDLFLETVIEIVEHLLDKLFVVQFGEDDVVFFVGHAEVP